MEVSNVVQTVALSCLGGYVSDTSAGLNTITELSIFYSDTEVTALSKSYKQNLRSFYILQGGFSTDAIVPFMVLPSLRSLTVGAFAGEDGSEWSLVRVEGPTEEDESEEENSSNSIDSPHPRPQNGDIANERSKPIRTSTGVYILPPKSSAITHIELAISLISSSLLSRILTLPVGLESFRYELGGATVSGDEDYIPRSFMPSLLAQANTLRELVIDTTMAADYGSNEPMLGSLVGLVALQRLVLPAKALLGVQPALPSEAVTLNSLDELLPAFLVALELHLEQEFTLADFLMLTGIPNSLVKTSRRIPTLRKFIIKDGGSPDIVELRRSVIAESRRLYHQIKLMIEVRVFFFYRNGD